MTDKENQKITITYKLKDGVASEEKPAKIYNLVTDYNTNWDATTEAVLHGHLGVVNEQTHEMVPTEYYDFLKITDAGEHTVDYKIMDHATCDGLTTYSVIDCDGKVSDTPTKIAFDRDTATSVVKIRYMYLMFTLIRQRILFICILEVNLTRQLSLRLRPLQ